jgi:hypothetical protein
MKKEEAAQKPTEHKRELGVWCPTCHAEIKSSERRPDGDSVCVNGHKHKTTEFMFGYTPSLKPTAPASLVEELRGLMSATITMDGVEISTPDIDKRDLEKILNRYTPTSSIAEEPLACLADRKGYKHDGVISPDRKSVV